jgi:cephalosporin-C deacetylase-like acetyl esterase
MNGHKTTFIIACLSLLLSSTTVADDDLYVLPDTIDGVKPGEMMKHYLMRQIQRNIDTWKQRYETRKEPEQITEYQKHLRRKFIEAIGGLPRRTPLNPHITRIVHRKGYRVEMVIFESQSKHYVTGALFLPDPNRFEPPYPAVLEPVGHSFTAKARDIYQTVAALFALNGMVAFVYDPIDQGERGQMLSQWPKLSVTTGHTMLAVGSILLGRNTARFEIWDGMRAIDYLQSRPEVDPNRIGCAGLSGGGTQTSYLMALDKRINVAAPACYLTGFERLLSTIGPQDGEQNIYGQLAFGMDHADYIMMRAPRPTLICAATGDFFDIAGTWNAFRYAKRLYSRMGFAERVDLIEHDGKHDYHQSLREATAAWMKRWLRREDVQVTEPRIELLSEEEMQCTPGGQVMLLDGARSVYDMNRDYEKRLAQHRRRKWRNEQKTQLLDEVRKIAGIRRLSEMPQSEFEELGVTKRRRYRIRKFLLKPESGIYLPALMFVPKKEPPKDSVLYVHEKGKNVDASPDGPIDKLVTAGHLVLAVDVRGIGETQVRSQRYASLGRHFGADWQDFYTAYLLGRSYVGMRAEDILISARFLGQEGSKPVHVIAVGNVGVPVLHAAALELDVFGSVRLKRTLISWSNVVELGRSQNQLVNTVHGALTAYDLPDLASVLDDKLTMEEPLNALGEPVDCEPESEAHTASVLNGNSLDGLAHPLVHQGQTKGTFH